MPPLRRLDHKVLARLLREVWPDVQLEEESVDPSDLADAEAVCESAFG